MKDLELVVEKRRVCGRLSPASAIAILLKTPADAVWTHDQIQARTTIYSSIADTSFLTLNHVTDLNESEIHQQTMQKLSTG